MSDIQKYDVLDDNIIESLILRGDISGLNQKQRSEYYRAFCKRLGLDASAQPFQILKLQGKETLYLTRAGAQQLNQLYKVSHQITSRERVDDAGVYQVTARASLPEGRFTESIGAVNISGLKNDAYANAIMKAETKAKRRSTLDLLGLGLLDETEVETIPKAITIPLNGDSATTTMPEGLNQEITNKPEVNLDWIRKELAECENVNQVKKYWSNASEYVKEQAKGLKEARERELVKEKFPWYVDKLDKTNFDKNRFFLESIIDEERDEDKKMSLMLKYNSRLDELGIEDKYELLPFEVK